MAAWRSTTAEDAAFQPARESLAKKASLLPKSCAVFASIVAESQRILLSK
jgi:hypothetical protein